MVKAPQIFKQKFKPNRILASFITSTNCACDY